MGNQTAANSRSPTTKSFRRSTVTAVTKSTLDNKEDITLIWLDRTIDRSRTTLRELTDYVLLFTEVDPCVAHIRSINQEHIFLIVSGHFAEACLDQVHDLVQLDSVFVFCMKSSKYRDELLHSERYKKIIDIFDDEDVLIQAVRDQVNDLHKQLSTFSLYEKQKPTRDLSQESASFLWFQLFKDVLLRMPRSDEAKREMIDQCRQYYRGNPDELDEIDTFARTYTNDETIRWYTKQCFIYRLCNKALRTEDIELLYTFRYYIQDLCKRLAVEHRAFREKLGQATNLTLYRGLKLTKDELHRFQSNVDALISTNGFLSTTRNYDLAMQFALKTSKRSTDVQPTLFVIQADCRLDNVIFADISSLSVYPDEEEVLFDLGCAFKITSVEFDDEKNLWTVAMTLTDEARTIVATYIDENRREMEKGNVLLVFGLLLTEMGHYHQAQVYFENLLASNTVDDRASLYTNIGRVKFLTGYFDQALKDFQTVYELQRQADPVNDLDLARTMNNISLIYMEEKFYDLALEYQTNVLEIYQKHADLCRLLLANSSNSIGVILTHKLDYPRALDYLLHAMKLYEEHLPTTNHATLATNYNSIGLVFYYTKQYQQALDYCLKALTIREKLLPARHPHIADSCNNVALAYHHLNQFGQALALFERALDIYTSNANQTMRVPVCFNNIGLLYLDQHEYDRALEFYFKAWALYERIASSETYREEIGFTLDNLGVAYEMKDEWANAVKYYEQAMKYQVENHEKAVRILAKLGNIHQKQANYHQALGFYERALEQSESCPPELVASLLMSMGIIHHRLHEYERALVLYKRAMHIRKHLAIKDDLDLAWIFNNIGCLYDDMGDVARALKYQYKAFHVREKVLPATHPDLATSLSNLGRIHQTLAYRAGGNPIELEQALQHYQSALRIRRESLPVDHPDLAISYYNLALVHIDQLDYERASSELQQALAIQRTKLPDNHPDLLQTLKVEQQLKSMVPGRALFVDRASV